MIVRRFLPSCLFCIFGSNGWTTLNNDAALILWFARIRQNLRLQGRDIAIKFLELGREGTRLGLFAGIVVIEEAPRADEEGTTTREGGRGQSQVVVEEKARPPGCNILCLYTLESSYLVSDVSSMAITH